MMNRRGRKPWSPVLALCRHWARPTSTVATLFALMICARPALAAANVFAGPFELRQGLYYYVVNDSGAAFTIDLKWSDPLRAQMDRPILARVFDPDERLLIRHDALGEKGGAIEQSVTLNVPASGKGVYQVVVTGFTATLEFATQPTMSFGLFGYPNLAVRGEQFANAWMYVPPGADTLIARGGEQLASLTMTDDAGRSRINLASAGSTQADLAGQAGRVWRVAAKSQPGGLGTLNFGGLPIVLCPDEATARAIHASVDVLDDGTICFHKFQVRAHELLKRYRAMPSSAFDVRAPVLIRDKADWLLEPARNQLLLGPYGVFSSLDAVLSEQNLQPDSPWFGCIYWWRDEAGRPRGNPWTRCDRLGLTRVASTVSTLAAVYSVRERFNRLAGDPALLNRIIIASLQELMMLREHELPLPEYEEYFGGIRAFTLGKATQAFPLFVRDCPDDIRALLTAGLQRWIDHETISQVGDVVNQWSFIVRGIQQFASGVDDDWYGQIVKRHIRWILDRNFFDWGFMPAGYFAEMGPDATYVGIALHNLGCVFEQTRDADLRNAIEQCIGFFNHTVAPEPDGSWQCASNFATRTPGGWSTPQWGAGVGMLANAVADAGPLMGRVGFAPMPASDGISLRELERTTADMLTSLDRQAFRSPRIGQAVLDDAAFIPFAVWQHFADTPLRGDLPMIASTSFTRAFGDELMCVRRPGYYASVYAGKPMPEWTKPQRVTDPHKQFPQNGGGLSMFWTPTFGSSLVAKNWSAFAAHTIVAQRDQTFDWEDYWSVQSHFDVDGAASTTTSSLLNQPITIERHARFLDEGVRMDTKLTVRDTPAATAVFECFPYPLDKPRPIQVRLLDEHGGAVNDRPASAICFDAGAAECHVIVFAQPRQCNVGVERSIDHYGQTHENGRILAEIARPLSAGETTATWMILAVPANRVEQAIRGALDRFAE